MPGGSARFVVLGKKRSSEARVGSNYYIYIQRTVARIINKHGRMINLHAADLILRSIGLELLKYLTSGHNLFLEFLSTPSVIILMIIMVVFKVHRMSLD